MTRQSIRAALLLELLLVVGLAAPAAAQGPTGPWSRVIFGTDAGPFDTSGTGSPENVVLACPGSTFRQTNGAAGNVFWVKDGGTGCDTTGWIILAGGGGGGSHNLLSGTHSDTVAAAAAPGSLIAGNGTPAWARISPSATGQVPVYNGATTTFSLDGSALTINASNAGSGTLPAGRLPALTGDVTSSAGSAATTIANDAVTYAKMQNVSAASKLLGRGDSGSGDPQEITIGTGLAMTGTTLSATGGGGGADAGASYLTRTSEAGLTNESNLGALTTGLLKITVSAGSATPSTATSGAGNDYVAPGAVTSSGLTQATGKVLGRTTASTGAIEELTPASGISVSSGQIVTSGAYTANGFTMSTARLLGRTTASSGAAEEISVGSGLSLSAGTITATGTGAANSDRLLGITIDGGGTTITTGVKGFIMAPVAGTITKATLLSTDASVTSCSIVIDVWKDTYANYAPTVADTITASAKPTLSSATKSQDSTLTGWTTGVTAGTIYGFNVDSVTGCTRVTLMLTVTP